MTRNRFAAASDIRGHFAAAMSAMYQSEVPQYTALLELVAKVNEETLAADPALRARLAATGELARLDVERHGAIRVGTARELATLRRLFAVMGMHPVGYYDLSVAGVPVHSTAFRPVAAGQLRRNPFRVFTSLLRLELIADASLRRRAETILAARDIFTPAVRELIARHEDNGGLSDAEARRFVAEALETFRWHHDATIDYDSYRALRAAHPLIADVVCFRGPHINHLTPRTLDIDAVQARMPAHGMTPKALIEGPPRRTLPILLRQTSFKALEEPIAFPGNTPGQHSARFGEVEQRGIALTPAGRALYDDLIVRAAAIRGERDNAGYQHELAQIFAAFPDDADTLRRRGLAYFQYAATGNAAPAGLAAGDIEVLLATGCLRADPIIYEDFLPVSAAGIFRSNLGDAPEHRGRGQAQRTALAAALGEPLADEMAIYAQISQRSRDRAVAEVPGLGG